MRGTGEVILDLSVNKYDNIVKRMTLQGSDYPKIQESCFLLRAGAWEREEHTDVIGELALGVDGGFVGIH